jgi:hypothetical protein
VAPGSCANALSSGLAPATWQSGDLAGAPKMGGDPEMVVFAQQSLEIDMSLR